MFKLLAVTATLGLLLAPARAPELVAAKVSKLPTIDGKADDEAWSKAKELVVKIDKPADLAQAKNKLSIKAVHDGDSVCFLVVWEDKTKSDTHMTYVWDGGEYKVPDDADLEDNVSLAFQLEGEFNADMLAGVESKWDVWEWAACRASNGWARDKTHLYAKSRPEGMKSRRFQDRNEKPVFLARPDDAGTPPFKQLTEPPAAKGAPKIPQFVPAEPTGSGADVRAKGEYAGGKWTVEFKRKLKTGHSDDCVFDPSKPHDFAVAVFDAVEHSDHDVSDKVTLKFEK